MVELARIVYDPPCSLEGLIHVLQTSKVVGECDTTALVVRNALDLSLLDDG